MTTLDTNPSAPVFTDYGRTATDVAPEGIFFIPASESPSGEPLVIVSHEVSGTLVIYALRNSTKVGVNFINPPANDFSAYQPVSGIEMFVSCLGDGVGPARADRGDPANTSSTHQRQRTARRLELEPRLPSVSLQPTARTGDPRPWFREPGRS